MDFASKVALELAPHLRNELAVPAVVEIVKAALLAERERCALACEEIAETLDHASRIARERLDFQGRNALEDNADAARSCAAACRRGA